VGEYKSPHFAIECSNQVATIWARPPVKLTQDEATTRGRIPAQLALANLMDQLRADDDVRVIVLHRGGANHAGNSTEHYQSPAWQDHHNDPTNIWRTFTGIIRLHEVMAAIEKPIIAQIDGDVVGGGCYIALSADLIVAREDARFIDHHLGMGQAAPLGPPFGLVPGDGGVALAPLYFTPPLAKEFLMLGKEYTARELEQRGIINYAVPAEQIDGVVSDLVARLLKRPAYPLAWAKRVVNRHVVDQLNRTLDAGAGYEMIGLAQLERQGWVDKTTLD
jgi:enoyl-CoA hydratase/carnithine racemase